MDPYPNANDVTSVKILSHNRTFYVFGGYVNDQVTKDILGFENETWSRVGSLTSSRIKFSVILNVNTVYIIGGLKKQKYEVCELSQTVDCKQDSSIEFQGSEEPFLFGLSVGSCNLAVPEYESKETMEMMILSNATFNEVDDFVPVKKTNYRSDKYIHIMKNDLTKML